MKLTVEKKPNHTPTVKRITAAEAEIVMTDLARRETHHSYGIDRRNVVEILVYRSGAQARFAMNNPECRDRLGGATIYKIDPPLPFPDGLLPKELPPKWARRAG